MSASGSAGCWQPLDTVSIFGRDVRAITHERLAGRRAWVCDLAGLPLLQCRGEATRPYPARAPPTPGLCSFCTPAPSEATHGDGSVDGDDADHLEQPSNMSTPGLVFVLRKPAQHGGWAEGMTSACGPPCLVVRVRALVCSSLCVRVACCALCACVRVHVILFIFPAPRRRSSATHNPPTHSHTALVHVSWCNTRATYAPTPSTPARRWTGLLKDKEGHTHIIPACTPTGDYKEGPPTPTPPAR